MDIKFDLTKEFDPNLGAEETIFDKLPNTKESQLAAVQAGIRPDEPEDSYIPSKRSAFIAQDQSGVLADSVALGTNNPLDDFQAPSRRSAEEVSAKTERAADSDGEIISRGFGYIGKLKQMQSSRAGANRRDVARLKAMDGQMMGLIYNKMQTHLESKGYDPNIVELLGVREGGGYRTGEEIDELIRIQQKKGVDVLNDEGQTAWLPANNWDEVKKVYDLRSAQQRKLAVSGKTAGGRTQEDLTKSLSNLNAAQEAYTKAQSTGDQRQISAAKIGLELAEDDTNRVSGGRLYQERHQSSQNSILQAIGNQGNPKINWGGVAYDDPSLKNSQDPTAKLSAEQYLASQVTNGSIPTVTFTKNANGEVIANADAAENYLNKVKAKQTLVASWDGPELKWFNFTPSAEQGKQLVPLTKKAPPASEDKKSSEVASPNESGKRLGAAVKPALQKTANFFKGLNPTTDELLNRADYVATGIRNNITAPAVEWAAGVAGEDLDMGRTPNPSVADRDKKQLTAKERAAILSRTQNPLTNLFLNK